MMFHNIQALLEMSQRSHTFFILFSKFCDKEIYNLFGLVLFKQFAIQIRLNFLSLDNLEKLLDGIKYTHYKLFHSRGVMH